MTNSGSHCVYIARHGNVVLYVGRTRDFSKRMSQHKSAPWWSPDVVFEVRPCRTASDAAVLERWTIAATNPAHNIDLSPEVRRRRAVRGDRIAAALAALEAARRPMTSTQIREATGYRNTAAIMKRLHEAGHVMAVEYRRSAGRTGRCAVWAIAPGAPESGVVS